MSEPPPHDPEDRTSPSRMPADRPSEQQDTLGPGPEHQSRWWSRGFGFFSIQSRRRLIERHRWLVFVVPFLVYMLMNSLEPAAVDSGRDRFGDDPAVDVVEHPGHAEPAVEFAADRYAMTYTLKLAVTIFAIWFVLPGYGEFPFRVSWLAVVVGALGIVIWIGFFQLGLEQSRGFRIALSWLFEQGRRSGFDPLTHWDASPLRAWGFLTVRFTGLVLIVPVIEEFFLRGFLMRFFVQTKWWELPFGTPDFSAIAITTLAAMAMHPAELFAELVWFSLVTLLMLRTRNIWDCVVAHAVTNLLLGIYVVSTGTWELM